MQTHTDQDGKAGQGDLADALCRLRQLWQKRSPSRARGGLDALRGFDYQLALTLLAVVRRWKESKPADESFQPSEVLWVECLSDFTEISADALIYVTQAKISERPDLPPVFDEFHAILSLVRDECPALESRIEFVLCAPVAPRADISRSLRAWAKRNEVPEAHFMAIQTHLHISEVPDPHDEILALLANDLHDPEPHKHLAEWFGRLLNASTNDAFCAVIQRVVEDLHAIRTRQQQHGGVYVWRPTDRPPSTVLPGKVLTGEQPRPNHLREGFFADRPAVYQEILETLTQWMDARADTSAGNGLPVFWIGGRSGTGKSVALLHLLANVHAQGDIHVLWVGNKLHLLPEAVTWACALSAEGKTVLVGADDPFTPTGQNDTNHWATVTASLESFRCTNDSRAVPFLVCCGPTEHAETLHREFRDDIDVKIEKLPEEQPTDLADLRSWYRARTGLVAPDVGDDNVLLVQLFFQWRTAQRLSSFAGRFARRIKQMEPGGALYDVFSRILAANRLYVGYPQAAIDNRLQPALRDKMRRLREEHHIADMDIGRSGVWLAHPHLSNAIYEEWYPADASPNEREAHLRDLVHDSVAHGESPREKMAPLWAIARAGRLPGQSHALVGRLSSDFLARLLPKLAADRFVSDEPVPFFELPAWIELRAIFTDVCFARDPFSVALRQLDPASTGETGFRLTCHKLMEHSRRMSAEQKRQFTRSLLAVLSNTVDSWFEWPHVATDAIRHSLDGAIEDLMDSWLRKYASKSIARRVLLNLLRARDTSERMCATAADILHLASGETSWADIAKLVLSRSSRDATRLRVAEWAGEHADEWRTGFLLGEMVRRGSPRAIELARRWATHWHMQPSANWVLEALCERGNVDEDVRDWALEWLGRDYRQTNPGFLAEKLICSRPNDRVVHDGIFAWLDRASATRGTWLYVWDAVYTSGSRNVRLSTLGVDALHVAWPGHALWRPIWKTLWRDTHDPRLIDAGLHWLNRLPMYKAAWIALWNILWKATAGNDELFAIGMKWLGACFSSRAWGTLWGRFWAMRKGSTELRSLAKEWLSRNLHQRNVWYAIWCEVWQVDRDDSSLYTLARRWLQRAPRDLPAWLVVWEIVWRYAPQDSELRQLGLEWLKATPCDHGAWQRVWAYLWAEGKDVSEIRDMGYRWLDTVPMSHGSWPKMWKDLWPYDKDNHHLQRLGRKWLFVRKHFNHGDWQHNWRELLEYCPDNEDLLALGVQWLKTIHLGNIYWVDVWLVLFKRGASKTELFPLAVHWLTREPAKENKWPNLWLPVCEAGNHTPALRSKVLKHLRSNPGNQEWFRLWSSLLKIETNRDLLDLGLKWLDLTLRRRPSNQSWHQVWSALRESSGDKGELTGIAVRWLQKVSPNDTAWHKIWTAANQDNPRHAALKKIGRNWLRRAKAHHLGWYYVWFPLFEASPRDSELLSLAEKWLDEAPAQHQSRGDGFLALLSREPLPSTASHAVTWLEHTAGIAQLKGWPEVWAHLWDASTERARLTHAGVQWIEAHPQSKEWLTVFDRLHRYGALSDRHRDLAAMRRNHVRGPGTTPPVDN